MTMPSPTPPPGSGPPGPQGHFTPPPAEPVSQSSSRRNLLIAGILGGGGCLLVLLVVIALVIFFAVRGGGGAGEGAGEPTPEEQMTAVVADYMDALAAGDAATALEIAPPLDESAVQLAPEAYTAALEAAPVAEVVIGAPVLDPDSEHSGTVGVDFTVGGEPVTHEFEPHDSDGDGTWTLYGLESDTGVQGTLNGLGFTLNGAPVEDEQHIVLLPGAYTPALSLEHFALSSDEPVLVTDEITGLDELEPSLTDDGLTAFRGAVQTSVDDCIAQTTLEGGCGMGTVPATTSDGWAVTEDSVRRSLPEDTQRNIDTMEATSSYDEPTYVEGEVVGTVDTEMDCTKDGQAGICEMWLGGGMPIPHVDMADPELPVTWS